MRIAIDVTALLPEATGVDVYILRLVEHLARIDRDNHYRVLVNYEDRHRLDGRLGANFSIVPLGLRPRPVRLVAQQVGLPLLAALRGVDVVHSPSFVMPWYRGRAGHVLTVYDMTSFTHPEVHIALRRSRAYRWAMHASIVRADVVTVPSRHTKTAMLEVLPNVDPGKIEIVAPGVSEEFRAAPIADDRAVIRRLHLPAPYILFVGTVEPRKNLARLVEAYAQLVSSMDVAEHLVVVGRLGWHYDALLARIARPPLRGRVHLAGYVAQADLPAVYRAARVFVYPSIEEGFGFPPLEAMASGVPTISSVRSALEENLRGAARLVDPGDTQGLAAALKALLTDEDERRRLRTAGLERAARYRWDVTARDTIRCYQRAPRVVRQKSA